MRSGFLLSDHRTVTNCPDGTGDGHARPLIRRLASSRDPELNALTSSSARSVSNDGLRERCDVIRQHD